MCLDGTFCVIFTSASVFCLMMEFLIKTYDQLLIIQQVKLLSHCDWFSLAINWKTYMYLDTIIALHFFFLYKDIKQVDSLLWCICSVIGQRESNCCKKIDDTLNGFLFLPHFDIVWEQLRNRHMVTWNQFFC